MVPTRRSPDGRHPAWLAGRRPRLARSSFDRPGCARCRAWRRSDSISPTRSCRSGMRSRSSRTTRTRPFPTGRSRGAAASPSRATCASTRRRSPAGACSISRPAPGLCAIAAMGAGASAVTAADIDPFAVAAMRPQRARQRPPGGDPPARRPRRGAARRRCRPRRRLLVRGATGRTGPALAPAGARAAGSRCWSATPAGATCRPRRSRRSPRTRSARRRSSRTSSTRSAASTPCGRRDASFTRPRPLVRVGRRQAGTPSAASRIFWTSSLVILSIASIARFARSRSGPLISSGRIFGTTCHDTPKRSFSQPQTLGSPPSAMSASQYRSTSAWSSQSMLNEIASLNLNSGPPSRAMNVSPSSVKSTVRTDPSVRRGRRSESG